MRYGKVGISPRIISVPAEARCSCPEGGAMTIRRNFTRRTLTLITDADPLRRRYEWTCLCGRSYGVHEFRCTYCNPVPLHI